MPLHSSTDRRRRLATPASHNHPVGPTWRQKHCATSRRSRAISKQLPHNIAWGNNSIPTEDIVSQGKTMCGQYIRFRLKRANMFNRKCGLQRLSSVAGLPGGYVVLEVFPELLSIGQELERMHPELYSGVSLQASSTPVIANKKAVTGLLGGVARELARGDVTWAKVVSLFAVAGGMAADCVRQGHPEVMHLLIESMGEALEFHLADWIVRNGGWTGLLAYSRSDRCFSAVRKAMLATAVTSGLFFLIRWAKLAFTEFD